MAPSAALAIAYFSQEHGFELDVIRAEELLTVPDADRPRSDLPQTPRTEMLGRWGFRYNETFHVFYDARGRIFRPEGIVREHMRASARENARQRLRKTS